MTALENAESFGDLDPLREPLIYRAVSPATLLSRAWNLLRYHLKASILLMLIPAFLSVISALVMLTPKAAAQMFEIPSYLSFIISVGLGFIIFGVAVLVRFACMASLSRLYFKTLMHGETMSLREAFKKALLKSFPAFSATFLMFLAILALIVVFFFFDFLALFVGMIGFYILLMLVVVAVMIPNVIVQLLFGLFALLLFLIGGGIIALSFVSLLGIQAGFCLFPVVGMANTDKTGFFALLETAFKSYGLLGANFVRVILFAVLLFIIYTVLSVAMMLPIQTWFIIEMIFNPPTGDVTDLPLYQSLMMSTYQALTFSVIWPYIFAAVTVFWYDCRVRSEALDIRLMLHRMNERLKSKTRVLK